MRRYRFFLVIAATTLCASVADALPQSGAGGGVRTSVRQRCAECGVSRDSGGRASQERLLLRLDSLRWQIENVRLSESERERVAQDMARTVVALQSSLDQTSRAEAAVAARVAVEAGPTHEALIAPRAGIAVARRTRGYLGVTFDGPSAECQECREHIIRFYQYPKIAMVEPDSPAERAGILEGDTLVAFNGTDVKNEISLTKLLVPQARIMVRVRREGDAKNLQVTVGEAPEYYVRRGTPLPARAPIAVTTVVPSQAVRARSPNGPMIAGPTPRAGGTMWIVNTGVAGARVETISEGLGKAVGVKEGVLVIKAEPGTPAHRSGLRDGDVILRAGGRTVATVNALRQAVESAEDESITLNILREKKRRELTLRW
jgi:hypothetical protein